MRTLPVGLVCVIPAVPRRLRVVSPHLQTSILLEWGSKSKALITTDNADAGGRTDLFSGDLIPSIDAVEAIRCEFT